MTKAKTARNAGNKVEKPLKMHKTANDLTKKTRTQIVQLLNERLADSVDLHMQMKQAHWNVKGPNFIGLHKLFDEIYEATEEYVDKIAERAVMLGGTVYGTARAAVASSKLPEYPKDISNGVDHVEAVTRALSVYAREVRTGIEKAEDLQDADTADLFTEVSRGADKWLWFVEAHKQASS
ncbi:MAG: DNA starvation/stationary phase protection protein Dps [Flavobacteriales bacterium]|nr:DNA starvation/stationary phase protection protein Dps [Flavobacteriales bacterium]